ncbi:MAG: HD domain-containing protein, partial [Candidatus Gastranaerophilales bacterium]|nr:HD domain-containing protein [Candidatus Gastranaerophilales bacterium]
SCCQYYNLNSAKASYKHLTDSCAKSAATALYNLPVETYLTKGKNELYNEQLATVNSICKNFNLKYLYVYVPDFENNVVTDIFYVDGTGNKNVKDRDLGAKVNWQLNKQEKDAFRDIENNQMFINKNDMGHTITSYAVIKNNNNEPIALVGADLDFDIVTKEMIITVAKIILFIFFCLLTIYSALMTYLDKVLIKPIVEITDKMQNFVAEQNEEFVPVEIETEDEFGLMAASFNKMVMDIKSYIRKISDTQTATIFSLAKLAQSRDDATGKHLERVQKYCSILTKKLAEKPKYKTIIDEEFIENIFNASPLHDIGKVGIPDEILLKKEKHTPAEFEKMKMHTTIGYETLQEVHLKFGKSSFIDMGMVIALYHHERWDGKGYPIGISGEKIPLAARIMAVADVYDALSSKRSYKEAFPKEKCLEIMLQGKATQFDPDIIETFVEIIDELEAARKEFEEV